MSLAERCRAIFRAVRAFGTSFDEAQRMLDPGVPVDVSRDKLSEPTTTTDEPRKGHRVGTETLIEVKQVECTECGGPVWGVIRTEPGEKPDTLAREHYKTKAAKAAHDAGKADKANGTTAVVRIEERNGMTERRYEATDDEKQLPLTGEATDDDVDAAKAAAAAAADPLA